MAHTWHGYIGMENLNLSNAQRAQLMGTIRALGPGPNETQPARINHWRTRLDNQAAIFEAAFDEDNLTVAKVKNWLANIFSVDPATIHHTTGSTSYGPLVTYARGGTDYIRMLAFGGIGSSWAESRADALSYLFDNLAEWHTS